MRKRIVSHPPSFALQCNAAGPPRGRNGFTGCSYVQPTTLERLLRLTFLSLLAALVLAAPARAASTVDYVRGAQNSDGGFGMTQSGGSSQLATGWALLGLAAAGTKPGPAAIAYVKRG